MPHPRDCRILHVTLPRPIRVPCLALACALFAIHGWSETAPVKDTLTLPDAQAQRHAPPPTDIAKTVIVPTDVDRQLGNLADMLQRAAGLHVVRTGDMGDYVGVSVWGSSEQQVNIYVDGVLQNQANDGSMFLGDWDLSRVERIEVYKGLAPDNLAGSPMGGSINIITRAGRPGTSGRAAVGAGSFGSLRANGSAAYEARGWRARVEGARNQADGDFPYYDDNGTEFEPGRHPQGAQRLGENDLTRKLRRNNAHGFSEIAANASYAGPSGWDLGAQADASFLHKQIPAVGPNVDSLVTVNAFRESQRLALRGYGHWTGKDAEASFDLSGTLLGEGYVDTSMGVGAIGVGYDDDFNAYSDLIGSLWGRAKLADGFTLAAFASYSVSGYRFTDRLRNRDYPRFYRYTGEGKITPVYTWGRHTIEAILAATLTLEEQYGNGQYSYNGTLLPASEWNGFWSARLGYQYRIREGIWIAAQAGNSYRIPTFLERFGDRGTIVANAGLKPEAGVNGSLGLHAERQGYTADFQGFASEGERIITLVQNSQFVMTYRNTGATRVMGLESRLTAAPRPWTRSELDLTLQQALDVSGKGSASDYKLIPYRPTSQVSLRQSLFKGAWTVSATGYYQGLAYPNASNQPSLFDSYSHSTEWQARCDADLAWRVWNLLLAAGVRNIFDQHAFDFFNYPLPGRSFAATVQAEF